MHPFVQNYLAHFHSFIHSFPAGLALSPSNYPSVGGVACTSYVQVPSCQSTHNNTTTAICLTMELLCSKSDGKLKGPVACKRTPPKHTHTRTHKTKHTRTQKQNNTHTPHTKPNTHTHTRARARRCRLVTEHDAVITFLAQLSASSHSLAPSPVLLSGT